MTLFSAPAYESYLQLCRDLRLERELRDGDFVDDGVRPGTQVCGVTVAPGVMQHGGVWLPRLDQILTMLEEAGRREIALYPAFSPGWTCQVMTEGPGAFWAAAGQLQADGRTREEAAARLWMAVTGRTVDA